jgi:uncharacterized protein (DUF2141 family)
MSRTRRTNPLIYVFASAALLVSSIATTNDESDFMTAQAATASPSSATLTLNISGFEDQQGQVMAALFSSEDSYKNESPLQGKVVKVTGNFVDIEFRKLRLGDYAFKLFHDVNNNGELDVDILGIPSETYYFSNNASDPFSAPEWEEARFSIESGRVTKSISLN